MTELFIAFIRADEGAVSQEFVAQAKKKRNVADKTKTEI